MVGLSWTGGSDEIGGSIGSSLIMIGVEVLRRNRRLRKVHLLLPSIITWYCRLGSRSTMVPVEFHLVGWFPCWFWTLTLSPTSKGLSSVVGRTLSEFSKRCECAFSLISASSDHSRLNVTAFGIWSVIHRPKSSSAGETPISAGGVLRWMRRVFATSSVSRDPLGLMLVVKMRFITLTALSARPLL